jgi:NodT family efflux transporter outer membrane factor (OMF) lipoprotein
MIPRELQMGAALPAAPRASGGVAHELSAFPESFGRTFMSRRSIRASARAHGGAPAWVVLALLGLTSAACMVGPKYKRPEPPPAPAAYKEPPPPSFVQAGAWKEAQPSDTADRGKWWTVFQDPLLNSLEEQVEISNQNLKQFEAQYRAASAAIRITRAGLYPTVTGSPSVTGSRSSANVGVPVKGQPAPSPFATLNLPFQFTYEADVWGRIHSLLEGDVATAQASAADLAAARLSVQALLAADYFQLRGQDTQKRLLDSTVVGYEKALELTTNRYHQGIASKLDVTQAQNQIDTTRADATDTDVLRSQYEHAIAVLLGKAPADLAIPPSPLDIPPPVIPAVLPGALLERRPDIAAAERRVAAANAQIGVAQAAFYPTIGFSASAGVEGNSLLNWFTWPSRFWSLGPSLAQTLFEKGGRQAFKEQTIADYDATVATYRETVLTAFQQVEDNLAALRILEKEEKQQQQAVNSAALATELSLDQYKGGITNYLQVITAQALELGDRRTFDSIQTRLMVASVQLIQALGGGWDASQLPAHQELLPPARKRNIFEYQRPSDRPPAQQTPVQPTPQTEAAPKN